MDPAEVVERCRQAVSELVSGRKIILAGNPVAGWTQMVDRLREFGSLPVLILGDGLGTGPLPDEADARWFLFETSADNPVEGFRQTERVFADPPRDLIEAVDCYDPGRDALVFVTAFQVSRELVGRPAFGHRRAEWVALEDKTSCDDLFDAAGVVRPPNEVVPAGDADALLAAHRRLDRGDGTVWAGDARDGFNGGSVFVRWIADAEDAATVGEASAFFAARCDRVRVAPFLEGIPCSIHGLVTEDGIAVFRPAEMVTLRGRDPKRFRYAGVATYYDPPLADREVMRAAARRVGKLLADRVDFRGFYGLDGVVTADGWLPTELNPRFGAAMGTVSKGLPDLPLGLLHFLAAETGQLPVTAEAFEEAVVVAADATRTGGGWTTVPRRWSDTAENQLPGGTLTVGPGPLGGFVRFTCDPDITPVGESVGPLVVRAFAYADEVFDAGIGPLEPALRVR